MILGKKMFFCFFSVRYNVVRENANKRRVFMMFCFVSPHHVWPVWSWLELCVRGSVRHFPRTGWPECVFIFISISQVFFCCSFGLFFMWLSTWYFAMLFLYFARFFALSGPNSINFFSIETVFILRNKVNLTSTQSHNNVVNNIIIFFYSSSFCWLFAKIFIQCIIIFFIGFDWFYCWQSMLIWLYVKFNWIPSGKTNHRFDVRCLLFVQLI